MVKGKRMTNIYKLLIFMLSAPSIIYGAVSAKLDSNTVELGEMVTYSLNVSGENITRPNIRRLCGTDVISTSSQTSMQIINGEITKSYVLSYKFVPQKSCKIEPIEVDINGDKEFSNALELKVVPVSAAKDKEFVLELSSRKKSVYVGETFDITLMFKQRRDSKAVDSKFIPPELKGFWIKSESQPARVEEGEYVITKLTYTLAAQRAGNQKVTKAQMRIATRSGKRDPWGAFMPSIKWKGYFSNELDIDVKPLPVGVDLIGNFAISVKAEKKEVNANEAVNIKIEVTGVGNLEDIKSFKPHIEDVSVFDEKISIEGNKLTQNIAFVTERDFTIPSFSLKYFDTKTKSVKTIRSEAIAVKVKNAKAKEELTIKREENQSEGVVSVSRGEFDKLTLMVTFILGLLIGVAIMLIKPFKFSKKEKTVSLKEPKNLLMKLLPYRDDEDVKKVVDILEKNIYSGETLELDNKALKEVLKRYNLQ